LTDVGTLLHGDDSKLILLVDPDQESLVVVVENTSGLGPLTLKTAGLEVLVATLEEEMIVNEGLLLGSSHGGEGVVLALELTFEGGKSLNDLGLNLESLGPGDGGTEGVVGEVTGDTDTGGVDHCVLILGEVGAVKLGGVHGADVLGLGSVTVVGFDDLIHEGGEIVVRFVGAGVDTDAGVGPLGTGEDSLLEGVAVLVLAVLALLPDVAGEALGEEGGGTRGEEGVLGDCLRAAEMVAHHGSSAVSVGNLK